MEKENLGRFVVFISEKFGWTDEENSAVWGIIAMAQKQLKDEARRAINSL